MAAAAGDYRYLLRSVSMPPMWEIFHVVSRVAQRMGAKVSSLQAASRSEAKS
jgi:hypothetical protein